MWRTLSKDEKTKLTIEGFALFPELLQEGNNKKYEKFSLWLVSKYGVVSTSMRDSFTAGGKEDIITLKGDSYKKVPQVLSKLNLLSREVLFFILNADKDILKQTWGVNAIESDKISQWITLAAANNKDILHSILDNQ